MERSPARARRRRNSVVILPPDHRSSLLVGDVASTSQYRHIVSLAELRPPHLFVHALDPISPKPGRQHLLIKYSRSNRASVYGASRRVPVIPTLLPTWPRRPPCSRTPRPPLRQTPSSKGAARTPRNGRSASCTPGCQRPSLSSNRHRAAYRPRWSSMYPSSTRPACRPNTTAPGRRFKSVARRTASPYCVSSSNRWNSAPV